MKNYIYYSRLSVACSLSYYYSTFFYINATYHRFRILASWHVFNDFPALNVTVAWQLIPQDIKYTVGDIIHTYVD